MHSGTELSAVVFGLDVHLILILVIFLLGLLEGQSLQQNARTAQLKENIRKEITSILADSFED
jgi:hypothetical protein